MEGGRRRIIVQDGRGELGVEAAHIAREFGKSEIDRAMQLAHPIAEVLQQAIAQAYQFAQFFRGGVGQMRGGRALLRGEVRDAECVNGIGLGALQLFAGETMRAQRIEQSHRVSGGDQSGKQVLPV
ncbi:MAG TPA: hypothetical protein VN744_04950, partial [Casimicrobiaceae bacterium]|nr:hypothetical protein [Casimicrobiaceae bacterium]